MSPTRLALALAAIIALAIPAPTFAISEPGDAPAAVTFDTPAPTPARVDPTPKPRKTPKPKKKPAAVSASASALSALPLSSDRAALRVGYSGKGVLRQAPLLVAELAGYFDAVGLKKVRIIRSSDALADVLNGDLDIAVVDKMAAAAASAEDPTLRAIAGYRNYPGGDYGGDVLLAAPRLVADEPATVIAFLSAHIQALQDLSERKTALRALELIQATDLKVRRATATDWPNAVDIFAPFDGGFGSIEEVGGLGELGTYLATEDGTEPDLDALIAGHTLSIAQTWAQLEPNPVNALAGPPGVGELVIGLRSPAEGPSPITAAIEAGYFEEAGFDSVEVVDVEEPLLGVLQAELDLGVIDAVDAADGAAQGLPLAALAGHRNYAADGAYGGDLLVASADVLGDEGSTISSFLIAYVRALQDLKDEETLALHDGGFGDRTQVGGLGELDSYLSASLGGTIDDGSLIESRPLEYAQAWWGLPANPTISEEAE